MIDANVCATWFTAGVRKLGTGVQGDERVELKQDLLLTCSLLEAMLAVPL